MPTPAVGFHSVLLDDEHHHHHRHHLIFRFVFAVAASVLVPARSVLGTNRTGVMIFRSCSLRIIFVVVTARMLLLSAIMVLAISVTGSIARRLFQDQLREASTHVQVPSGV